MTKQYYWKVPRQIPDKPPAFVPGPGTTEEDLEVIQDAPSLSAYGRQRRSLFLQKDSGSWVKRPRQDPGGVKATHSEVAGLVYEVLRLACEEIGGCPVSAATLRDFALDLEEEGLEPPVTSPWRRSPFDYEDRLTRWLDKLVKVGLVTKEGCLYEPA